jgi:hypothetical protein
MNRSEIEQFAGDNESAEKMATKGGHRPSLRAGDAAIFSAIGAFILLDIFAAITLPDLTDVFWPVVLLTGAVAAAAYFIVSAQEKAWSRRYHEVLEQIRSERGR